MAKGGNGVCEGRLRGKMAALGCEGQVKGKMVPVRRKMVPVRGDEGEMASMGREWQLR